MQILLEIKEKAKKNKDSTLITLMFITVAIYFLPTCWQIGFYLDDWLTLWNLHFSQHTILDLIKASFADPRMITRPFQCVYYAITYFLFGEKPLAYHLLRFFIEFLGISFLYLSLVKLFSKRSLAFCAALIFAFYPSHDSTHFWIGAGLGPGCGLTLFLASLYFFLVASDSLDKNTANNINNELNTKLFFLKSKNYYFSLILFTCCAYCYEAFLPMLAMIFLVIISYNKQKEQKNNSTKQNFKTSIIMFVPFILIAISEPLYQRILLPKISKVFLSPGTFDLNYFISVFIQGLNVSIGPLAWKFFSERAFQALLDKPDILLLICILFFLLIGYSLASYYDQIDRSKSTSSNTLYSPKEFDHSELKLLLSICIPSFFLSYLTFAVAQGYTPVLDSIINRVNIGASIPVSICIAYLFTNFFQFFITSKKVLEKNYAIIKVIFSGLLFSSFILFLTLVNTGYSSFWKCSWQIQKNIHFLVKENKEKIGINDSLILINTPRYIMWSPVFDGTWDFQSMVRMILERKDAKAGVISERIHIKNNDLKDIALNYECASYPLKTILIFNPQGPENFKLTKVASLPEFLDILKSSAAANQSARNLYKRLQAEQNL